MDRYQEIKKRFIISCTYLEPFLENGIFLFPPTPPPPFLFFRTTESLGGKIDETQVQG